jgi:hypothetical protein
MREKYDIRLVIGLAALIGIIYALVIYYGSAGFYDGIYADENRAAHSKSTD